MMKGKKRSFDQPILLKWIEIFTTELPKPEDIQFLNPLFGNLLQQITAKSYTSESIYNINGDEENKESQNEQFDQRKFLEIKFELDQPIDPHYWEFISSIFAHKTELITNPKIWKLIYPYLMRFFIQYDYQFNLQANNFFLNPAADNEIFQNVKFIIPLIYLFPHSKPELDDILMCLSAFINQLKKYLCTPNNFFHDQVLRSIADEIFASCHILLAPIEFISLRYSIPVQLSFLYFNSFCSIFGVEDISHIEIEFLINTLSLIPRIDISIFQSSPENFLSPLVDGSLRVLNILRNYKIPEFLTRQSFCLGISIIDKFTHLFKMNIDNNSAFMKQYSEGMADIAYFILWCLDNHPINILNKDEYFQYNPKFHDQNYHLISPEVTASLNFLDIFNYNFIDIPTFSEPVKTIFQFNEENSTFHDFHFKTLEFQFPEIIKRRRQLIYLATKIILFMHALSEQNIVYLKKFVEVILEIISFLFDDGKTNNFDPKKHIDKDNCVFDIKGHNLPLSFYYFVICLFNKCNSNMICAVFSLIQSSFYSLLQPSIFSPFINKWISKSFINNNHDLHLLNFEYQRIKNNEDLSTSHQTTEKSENNIFDDQRIDKNESSSIDNQTSEKNENNIIDDQRIDNNESSNIEDQTTDRDQSSSVDKQITENSENTNDEDQTIERYESSSLNNRTVEINENSSIEDQRVENNEVSSVEGQESRKEGNSDIESIVNDSNENSIDETIKISTNENDKEIQITTTTPANEEEKQESSNNYEMDIDELEVAEQNKEYFKFVFEIRSALIHFLNLCFHVTSSSDRKPPIPTNNTGKKDQFSPTSKKTKKKAAIVRSQSQQLFSSSTASTSTSMITETDNPSSKETIISNVRIDENSSFSECFELDILSKKETNYNYDLPFDKNRVAFLMMSSIYSVFKDSAPQIFDEISPLLLNFIYTDPDFLIKSSNKAGIFEMLMDHTFNLQLLHIGLKKSNNSKYQKFLPDIENSRLYIFLIFDEFLRTNSGKLFIFSSQMFVQYLVHFLFEPPVMNFASDLIKRCVMLNSDSISKNNNSNQFKIIFRNISELIKTTIGHLGDFKWIKLILVLIGSFKDTFAINRNSIFDYLRSQQVLLLLSRLPIEVVRSNPTHFVLFQDIKNDEEEENINDYLNFVVSEDDKPYMKIFEDVFDIFIHLSRENHTFAKDLASSYDGYYENITSGLKLIKFGKSIVDRLLSLVFEQPLSIEKLPSTAQIRNYFALPFLFNSTTHLPFHSMLMHFLADVCIDSISNKLRVFQAHLPEVIIDYLQNFPSQNEQPKSVINSIATSLRLFSIISQYVFSVPTLFRCIQAMRTRDGNRVWWTGQLLSLFSTYIENSAKSSPCAFFYLDGRHTGFFLQEEISQLTLSKGWSFMCRFELDSFGYSNIGGVFPVLLYMQFKNGDSFSISFTSAIKILNDKKQSIKALKITYQTASTYNKSNNNSPSSISSNDTNSKHWNEIVDTFEIEANTWYDLIFSSDFNLYISTSGSGQYFSLSLKNTKKVDLKQGVQTTSIGNTPPLVASEAPLVANISSFYFFTGTMNSKTVELLLSLPLSFVFGFSPSERKLDPRLPEKLFNDNFDSRLFLGINARKTDGSTCFNIAKKSDIQRCTFRGVAFPFSTSFIDIINYSGGLKLFLPLFEQVNLSMYKEENLNDNSTFFLQLISMIQSFFQHSKALEADFVRYDGFKAMSYSLMKINPQYYMKNIIYSLFIICTILEPGFRSIMIDEIWLNFNIWKKLSVDIQSYIYDTIFNELKSSENFRDHIQIGELCAVIAEQPVDRLRQSLWRLLASMAQISFSSDEQDSLFSFLFLKENVPFQLEALQCFYELCSLNINDICSVFQRKRKFSPFLQLLSSEQEKVRLISLKIIFIIFHFFNSDNNVMSNNNNILFADQFDTIILTAVHQLIMPEKLDIQMADDDFKIERFTQETWKTIMSIAFNNNDIESSSDLRFIVPIACSCSHFFDNQALSQFQSTLELLLEQTPQNQYNSFAAKNVTDCSCWYFWLLYFSIQKADEKYVFKLRENDALTFGRLFEYMVQIDRIDEAVFFFNWVCYTRGWNTMPLLNLIFEKCLSSFKKCHFTKFINIVFEIFMFLFYIKNNERYARNIQLYSEHSQIIRNHLFDEIDACISLDDYIKCIVSNSLNDQNESSNSHNSYLPPSSDYFSFSMRINEDGVWLDLNLAKKLIAFISVYSEKKGVTTMSFSKIPKTKLAEIFAFLIYSVVRVDPSSSTINNMLIYIKRFYSQKSIDSLSFKFITTAFAKVSLQSKISTKTTTNNTTNSSTNNTTNSSTNNTTNSSTNNTTNSSTNDSNNNTTNESRDNTNNNTTNDSNNNSTNSSINNIINDSTNNTTNDSTNNTTNDSTNNTTNDSTNNTTNDSTNDNDLTYNSNNLIADNENISNDDDIQIILNNFYKKNSTLMNDLNADFTDDSFCLNVIQEYGSDIATWLEILQGFTINVCEIYKQRYSTLVPQIRDTISNIKKPFQARSYTKEMDDNCIALKRKQRRNRSLTAKIFRKIQRAMTVNGGPWCDNKAQNHWKLAPRTDEHFRHLFVRPNWHFDIHKVASLRRDKAKNEQAKLEYLRWIENQDVNATSTEFSIEDADDIQQQQQQLQQQQPTKSQYQFTARMITIAAVYDGNFSLNRTEICFDGVQVKDECLFSIEGNSSKTVEFNLFEIIWVLHRSYLHIDRGLEFFCKDGRSYFFYFSLQDRNQILKILSDYRPPNLTVLQRTNSQRCFSEQRFTEEWLNKEMSTYDYLMTVNLFAGRSYNDLSQYPVFPWILADYTSDKIDIDANPPPPGLFRDLSKPVGALNEKRLIKLKKELEILRESNEEMLMNSNSCLNESPCLYRCHYSTAYYVLLYMIRLEPFTTMHILMQDNKFDHPDRLFSGIEKAWNTVSSTSNDFRELIPEFFTLPEFLTNSDGFDLGLSKDQGNNVILPKWAKNPYNFIDIHRRALESDYVAQNIGNWIDLIFGYKQNGQAAEEANNTFHAYCYPSVVNSPEVKANHELLYEVQKHAGSFGIIPRQLFTSPHPNFPPSELNTQNESHQTQENLSFSEVNKNNNNDFALSDAYKADSEIINLFVSNHLYFVTSEAKLLRLKPKHFVFESSVQIPFGVGKSTALFPKLKLFVVTSPSGDAFHTFSIDSYTTLTHIFSFRQQFSSLTTIVGIGDSILVVLSQDGSLTVWDFSTLFTKLPRQMNFVIPSSSSLTNINSINNTNNNISTSISINNVSNTGNAPKRSRSNNTNNNDPLFAKEEFSYLPVDNTAIPKANDMNQNNFNTGTISFAQKVADTFSSSYDPVYKVNHHLVSAVCATASSAIRLIVSCDTSRRIVLAELSDGSFIRSFSIPDESAVPVGLLILDAGYIVTFCEHRSHNDVRSTIQIYALDSSMLSIFDHPRRVTTSCAINLVNGKSFIAVAFEDGIFVILSSPDASVVHTRVFSSPITAISQKNEEKLLFLANAEKQIFSLVLDL